MSSVRKEAAATPNPEDLENGFQVAGRRLTAKQEQVREEVEKYSFFNPKLQEAAHRNGDIYEERLARIQKTWGTPSRHDKPYLKHVKTLSGSWPDEDARWPTLRLLADFMEIGTSPIRWKSVEKEEPLARGERFSRTNVTRLDYHKTGAIAKDTYDTAKALEDALEKKPDASSPAPTFRLFIVEDLSRDVIELLGAKFDIEPHFFREHIFDYAWYNTRDRWFYPPRFHRSVREQRWVQLRYPTARYFESSGSFKKAVAQADKFNVFRRPDDDTNNRARWDDKDAKIGISRTRASFWRHENVGIILVDPTVQEGISLWYGSANWEKTPSMHATTEPPKGPPRTSTYHDLIHWAQRPESLGIDKLTAKPDEIPLQALLSLVASEWLIMSEYIKTRLGQIEWEISYPEHFLAKDSNIDVPLRKLHTWRRLVPLYREMLNETLQGVFHLPAHTIGNSDLGLSNPPTPVAARVSTKQPSTPGMEEEFTRALSYMEEYQLRIDRLTSVVTAIISIADSRHSQADNRNVARLTWLATFFVPLSFVASLFSMTENVQTLMDTYKWFAIVAIPLSCTSIGLGVILTLPSVQKWWARVTKWGDQESK